MKTEYNSLHRKIYSDYSVKSTEKLLQIIEKKNEYNNDVIEVVTDILIERNAIDTPIKIDELTDDKEPSEVSLLARDLINKTKDLKPSNSNLITLEKKIVYSSPDLDSKVVMELNPYTEIRLIKRTKGEGEAWLKVKVSEEIIGFIPLGKNNKTRIKYTRLSDEIVFIDNITLKLLAEILEQALSNRNARVALENDKLVVSVSPLQKIVIQIKKDSITSDVSIKSKPILKKLIEITSYIVGILIFIKLGFGGLLQSFIALFILGVINIIIFSFFPNALWKECWETISKIAQFKNANPVAGIMR